MLNEFSSLLADRIRHDDYGLIASDCTNQRKTDSLIATGGLNNYCVLMYKSLLLSLYYHVKSSSGLDGSADIGSLKLNQYLGTVLSSHSSKLNQRSIPDCIKYVLINHLSAYLLPTNTYAKNNTTKG